MILNPAAIGLIFQAAVKTALSLSLLFLPGKKSLHLKKPYLSYVNLNKRSGIHGAAANPH
jgi:hypothetical protein